MNIVSGRGLGGSSMSQDENNKRDEMAAEHLIHRLTNGGFTRTRTATSLPFDNLVYELSKGPTQVRISRDRGDWYVEVGPTMTGEYFPVEMWADLVNGVEPTANSSSFAAKQAALIDYVDRIHERLEPTRSDDSMAAMHARGERVIELMYPSPEGDSRKG